MPPLSISCYRVSLNAQNNSAAGIIILALSFPKRIMLNNLPQITLSIKGRIPSRPLNSELASSGFLGTKTQYITLKRMCEIVCFLKREFRGANSILSPFFSDIRISTPACFLATFVWNAFSIFLS